MVKLAPEKPLARCSGSSSYSLAPLLSDLEADEPKAFPVDSSL